MKRFWFDEGPALGWVAFRLLFSGALLLELPTSQSKNLHAVSSDLFHLPYVAWLPAIPPPLWPWLHWVQYPLILMLGLGLWTRCSAALLLALHSWIFFADALDFRNHPYFFLMLLAAIVLQPSVGSWIGRPGSSWVGRSVPWCWPRVIQIQLSFCYLVAALHKLHQTYLSGAVLSDLEPGIPPILAWIVVVTEAGLAFGLWIPRVRLLALCVGILFHVQIGLLLDIRAFSLAIIAVYALFAAEIFARPNGELR